MRVKEAKRCDMANDDPALVARTLRGDQQAFVQLVEKYQTPVYNLAYRMLGNPQDAEDAAQETFLRAYMQLTTYRPARPFATWLLSIAAHYCIDQHRRSRATLSFDDLLVTTDPAGHEPLPEEMLLDREQQMEIQAALGSLPPRYRLLLILRYWHDLSYAEMGEILHLAEGTVKVGVFRAREALGQRLLRQSSHPQASLPISGRWPEVNSNALS